MVRVKDVEVVGGSDIPHDPTELILSAAMYQALSDQFDRVGRPVQAISMWLDKEGVAKKGSLAVRISELRFSQGYRLMCWLEELAA